MLPLGNMKGRVMAVAKHGVASALVAVAWAVAVSSGLSGCGVAMDPGSVFSPDRTVPLPPPVASAPAPGLLPDDPGPAYARMFEEDGNLIRRFQSLRHLQDVGLITHEEYEQRRGANLGALLPYTVSKAPAYGLGRPAPEPEQIIERLKAIASNYQEQSISAEEQSVERSIILEALMPAKVDRRADRPSSVADDLQYSARMGRLQRFLDANVITKAEADRERKALSAQLAAANAQREAREAAAREAERQAEMSASGVVAEPLPVVPPSSRDGVMLGSYGSKRGAERAWQSLQQQFPAELANLTPHYAKAANRRRGSGYRLSAGPVADAEAAKKVCRTLKLFDLNCTPTVLK